MAIDTAFSKIEREIGFRRCLILDGNVNDVYLDDRGKLNSLTDYLQEILEEKHYDIVSWDAVTGLKGDTSHLKLEDLPELDGEQYNLFDSDDKGTNNQARGAIKADAFKDIFNLIRINMLSNAGGRFAFIINWADYIFGDSSRTDTPEREWLTLLGKALCDKSFDASLEPYGSIVIFITRSLALFPVSFYQRNPEVGCVTIPKPDHEERRYMFEKYQHQFHIREENDALKKKSYIDMMDDFSNKEILQMAKLSKVHENMSFDKLFYLYRYGEKDNPWEKLDYERVQNIRQELKQSVIGQDEAIAKIEKVVIKAYMGLTGVHKSSSRNAPKGILFFVGPTGVGKTELCKALARFLFGNEQACIRFDMSEYTAEHSDQRLIGAPPGYVGYENGGQLTNAVRQKPFSIILFDEIEKAAKPNPRILDIFLQILEDGRLTDNKGETVYFSESIIVFTSNLGAANIKPEGTNREVAQQFVETVKNYFNVEIGRPELLGRIGYNNIVPFNFIKDKEFTQKIARAKLRPVKDCIREKYGLDLKFEDENAFVEYILGGADTGKGGRDIVNAINDRLLDELAVYLFNNKEDLKDLSGCSLSVSVRDGEMNFSFD